MNIILKLIYLLTLTKAFKLNNNVNQIKSTKQMCTIDKDGPKLCINCKFYLQYDDPIFSKCTLNILTTDESHIKYYITNKNIPIIIEYHYCSIARSIEYMCGKNGTKYVKK